MPHTFRQCLVLGLLFIPCSTFTRGAFGYGHKPTRPSQSMSAPQFQARDRGLRQRYQCNGKTRRSIPNLEIQINTRKGFAPYIREDKDIGLRAKQVILTFDDGPTPNTLSVLKQLATYRVRATFFQQGNRYYTQHYDRKTRTSKWTIRPAQQRIGRLIQCLGHSIGSHSWDHQNQRSLERKLGRRIGRRRAATRAFYNNILFGHKAIIKAIGPIQPLFRFPYGAQTWRLRRYLRRHGLATFLWGISPRDWELQMGIGGNRAHGSLVAMRIIRGYPVFRYRRRWRSDAQLYAKRYRWFPGLKNIKKGIVLMHDIHPKTTQALKPLLCYLSKHRYTHGFFTGSKRLGRRRYRHRRARSQSRAQIRRCFARYRRGH